MESLETSVMVRSVPGEAGRHHAGVGDGLEGAHLGRQVGADGGAARVGGGDGGHVLGAGPFCHIPRIILILFIFMSESVHGGNAFTRRFEVFCCCFGFGYLFY